jgi:DNA-binding response OmpR family regulator
MKRKTPRILLADREHASRQALCRRLESAGYSVQTAEDGEDVLLLCDLDPPDILIMDVQLPDMDGFEVCECVRRAARGSDLTVIITTEAMDQMTRTYLGQMVDYVDGDYFFTKPCDSKLLVQLLDDLAEKTCSDSEDRRSISPTHVVWPTTRPRPRASRN